MEAMDTYDIKRLALVLAVQAEIEGMKAENDRCKLYDGVDPTYNHIHFQEKSMELQNLAHAHYDQL